MFFWAQFSLSHTRTKDNCLCCPNRCFIYHNIVRGLQHWLLTVLVCVHKGSKLSQPSISMYFDLFSIASSLDAAVLHSLVLCTAFSNCYRLESADNMYYDTFSLSICNCSNFIDRLQSTICVSSIRKKNKSMLNLSISTCVSLSRARALYALETTKQMHSIRKTLNKAYQCTEALNVCLGSIQCMLRTTCDRISCKYRITAISYGTAAI